MKKSFFVFITLSVFSLIFTGCESAGIILGGISQGLNNSVGGSSSPSYSTSSSSSSSGYSSSYSSNSDSGYRSIKFNVSVPVSCSYFDFNYDKQSFSYTYYTTVTAGGYTDENCRKSAESIAYGEASSDVWKKLRERSDYNSELRATQSVGTPSASRSY